jgi:hypothetical protein
MRTCHRRIHTCMYSHRFAQAIRESDPDWHGDDEEDNKSTASARSKQLGKSTSVVGPKATSSIAFVNPQYSRLVAPGVQQAPAGNLHANMRINHTGPTMQPPTVPPMHPTPRGLPAFSHSVSAASPITSPPETPHMYGYGGRTAQGSFSYPQTHTSGASGNVSGHTQGVEESVTPSPSKMETGSFWKKTFALASALCLHRREETAADDAARDAASGAAGSAATGSPPAWTRPPPELSLPRFSPAGASPVQRPHFVAVSPPPQYGGSHPGSVPASPPGVVLIQQVPSPPQPRMAPPQVTAVFAYTNSPPGPPAAMQYPLMPANPASPVIANNLEPQVVVNFGSSAPPMAPGSLPLTPPGMHSPSGYEKSAYF